MQILYIINIILYAIWNVLDGLRHICNTTVLVGRGGSAVKAPDSHSRGPGFESIYSCFDNIENFVRSTQLCKSVLDNRLI